MRAVPFNRKIPKNHMNFLTVKYKQILELVSLYKKEGLGKWIIQN